MRTIERTGAFKRDYKREKKSRFASSVDRLLEDAIRLLVTDEPLPSRHQDHALAGDWAGHRDCHLKPDLVLIYKFVGIDGLRLVRLGSHSELGL